MSRHLKFDLKPHQKDAVRFHLQTRYSINALEMGLGKTLVAIATALIRGYTTLVVCPSFLAQNWRDEIHKFSANPQKVTNLTSRMKPNGSNFYIVSYTSFLNSMDVWEDIDCLVCDEVHYLKNTGAQRTKRVHQYLKKFTPKMFMGLSGTPIKNNVAEFWSILKLCHYGGGYGEFDRYPNEWTFCKDFALKIPNPYNPKGWDWGGMQNVKLLKEVIRPVYFRRRAKDVLDLPESVHRFVKIKSKSKHDKALKEAWKKYSSGDKDENSFASAKAVNALSKVKQTVELAQQVMDSGKKVVIFTDHVQAANEIVNALNKKKIELVSPITGGTYVMARHQILERFKTDDRINFIVGTFGAMSVGLNITEAHHMIINDYPWVPADLDQAEKRIKRMGQNNTCFYYYLFSSDMDQYIFQALKEKKKIVTEVIDGES